MMIVSADVTASEWDAYVAGHPGASIYHQWEWRRIFETAFRHRTEYLVARDAAGTICGVLPLVVFEHRLFGHFMVSLPFVNYGGLLAGSPEARSCLVAEARARATAYGLHHVELRHIAPQVEGAPQRAHKVSMTLPLCATEEEAWTGLDRKVRNQVRKAEKAGLVSEAGGLSLLPEFYAVFSENMRDLGTPVYPQAWFGEMLRRFPDQAGILVVRDGHRAVAAALMLTWRGVLEIPSASALQAYKSSSANMLLYWRVMEYAIRSGARVLDFGRSTPGGGTYRFKQQWGAEPGPLTWEYLLVSGHTLPDRSPESSRFQPAIAAWKRLPLAVANRVGPAVVRYLP